MIEKIVILMIILINSISVLAISGCTNNNIIPDPIKSDSINWSISKHSEQTGKDYEELLGYKATFFTIDEMVVDRISEWIDSCDSDEGYHQYINSDSDSWEMYLYYPIKANMTYDKLKFYIEESSEKSINIYVESNDAIESKNNQEYLLILVQAPYRGAWPSSSRLFVDGQEINLENQAWTH